MFGFFIAITIGSGNNGVILGGREGGLPRTHRAADLDRDRDPALPALRHRPADLADALLHAAHRAAVGVFVGARAAHDARAAVLVARSASRPRHSPRRRSSLRCARACSGSSTAASTAPATTPRRPSRRSALRLRDAVDVETVLRRARGRCGRLTRAGSRHRLGEVVRRLAVTRISRVTLAIVGLFLALAACNIVLSSEIPAGLGLKGVGIITLPVRRRRPAHRPPPAAELDRLDPPRARIRRCS